MVIVRYTPRIGISEVRFMTLPLAAGTLNVIVVAALTAMALITAWRKEPVPLLLTLVTTKLVV